MPKCNFVATDRRCQRERFQPPLLHKKLKLYFKNALHERCYYIVRGWHLNSTQSIYQRMRRIIALSNQIALILKCVDSVNAKRIFKSVKLIHNPFLNNIVAYLSVFFA